MNAVIFLSGEKTGSKKNDLKFVELFAPFILARISGSPDGCNVVLESACFKNSVATSSVSYVAPKM